MRFSLPRPLAIPALRRLSISVAMVLALGLPLVGQAETTPQTTAFTQALAEAAARSEAIATFYRDRNYATLWTGAGDAARREALLTVIADAGVHGLPIARYDAGALAAAFRSAVTEGDRGRLEAAMTRAFLDYAHDIGSGVLDPKKVDSTIVREVTRRDEGDLLRGFATSSPFVFLHALAPRTPEYAQLVKAKIGLEGQIAAGGWGPKVAAEALKPDQTGEAVVALRDRLVAMGYLAPTASAVYDRRLQAAVQRFQLDHGQVGDGLAGQATLAAINIDPEKRLQTIVVALERLRWMAGMERGDRHIWVNLPDFTAKVIDHGKVTFQTRVVIGKNVPDQRSPEFSDEMEFMVANPSWNVPRSITTKEYLPLLQRNPNAVSHLQVIDGRGRVVSRGTANFAAYSARNFPFALRQPPSNGNALGLVKFMFPNQWNIYLHDTPAKSLFGHDVRAYSHGCIRVADPFDLAHVLLGAQSDDPKGDFQLALRGGRETRLDLDRPVPVHLVYFTAWPAPKGRMTYRADVYGRDARIYQALQEAGVVLGGVQG